MSESQAAETDFDQPGPPPGPPPAPVSGAQITYRYLRFGIVAAVVLLAISIIFEILQTEGDRCLQGSVSAYYYTPVRSIFVGVLMAIGLCLIVIRGRTILEDVLLNLAGMLAPVVALVPTDGQGQCASIRQSPVDDDKGLAPWVTANVQNNMWALFITGGVALLGLGLYFFLRPRAARRASRRDTSFWVFASLGFTMAVVGVCAYLFRTWDAFERNAHYVAAVTMFGVFGLVVLVNDRARPPSRFRRSYRTIWLLMLASVTVLAFEFDHRIFVLEALEIGWFALFWVLQSLERWEDVPAAMEAGERR